MCLNPLPGTFPGTSLYFFGRSQVDSKYLLLWRSHWRSENKPYQWQCSTPFVREEWVGTMLNASSEAGHYPSTRGWSWFTIPIRGKVNIFYAVLSASIYTLVVTDWRRKKDKSTKKTKRQGPKREFDIVMSGHFRIPGNVFLYRYCDTSDLTNRESDTKTNLNQAFLPVQVTHPLSTAPLKSTMTKTKTKTQTQTMTCAGYTSSLYCSTQKYNDNDKIQRQRQRQRQWPVHVTHPLSTAPLKSTASDIGLAFFATTFQVL